MSQNEEFTITIPKTLVKKLRASIKDTNFTSLTQYIISLIRKALAESEETGAEKAYTEKEEEIIKKRLRGLGYID
ncbi:MAG: CopG family transcriptional regulator [Candidatus Helarchaeota archaeon]|nr:CopG family transcriptional regulator [Candidatus Helarchaeota archaeon]